MRGGFGIALATLALVGCQSDPTVFQPLGDGGGGDGPPAGIHIQVMPPATTVSEGGQATVQVRLSEPPPDERIVDVVGAALLTPTPAQLTFTPANWNVNRTVILAAGQDDDAEDSPITVLFSGRGEIADGAAMIMITDDDELSLVVTPPSALGVTEGNTAQVQVQLSAQPTSNLVVSVTSDDPSMATVSAPQLTFTAANWDDPQNVTITGTDDGDTVDDSTFLQLDPAPEGVATVKLAIDVVDNDILAIDASPTNLGTLTEAAGAAHSGTIAVRLTQVPPGPVTVALAAAPGGTVGLGASQLTFTPATYATLQQVTVTALADSDVVDEQVAITLSATGLTDRVVQVTIDDDDDQVLQVTPAAVPTLTEGTATNLGVRLAYEPAGTVLVDVVSNDPMVAAINQPQLTFTPATYATVQQVLVSALDDANLADGGTTISFNAGAIGLTVNRAITIDDDDTQALVVTPATLAINEGGQDDFTVRLLFEPAGAVMVGAATTATADLGLAPATLVFGPGDYATPRPVTVSALHDADVAGESATVSVTSAGLTAVSVGVDISDDDALDIVVTPAMLAVTEGDAAGRTLMVSLGAMPAADVTVTVSAVPAGVVGLDATTLTFTPASYATPQAVVVTGSSDADGADESATVHLAAPTLDEKTVPVTVADDEVITPVVTPSPVGIDEGRPDASVGVRLSHDPGRAVTVEVSAPGALDLEVSPSSFTFDSSDWNVGQPVTLTALEDDEVDDEVETALFQIAGEGQAALTVNVNDRTVMFGFAPPHGGTASAVTGLEAYRGTSMPPCWVIEKVAVTVAASPGAMAKVAVALYDDQNGEPKDRVWQSPALTVGAGAGLRIIDISDVALDAAGGMTWLAIEATTGVMLERRAADEPRCRRGHSFGSAMPDPFDQGGPDPVCADAPPLAVWLIGAEASCPD